MQISKENISHHLSLWWLQIDQLSGRNLDEPNEYWLELEWVEVEDKKNNDSFSVPCSPGNR